MKSMGWFLTAMIVFVTSAFARQPDRVLVFNAEDQGVTCLMPLPLPSGPQCPPAPPPHRNFLVQGERTELRVYNRKFLSDYTITIEAVTTLVGPKIRNIEEAEGLNFTTPSFIPPPPAKGGVEGVPVKTSADFVLMMLDANQPNEVERELMTEVQQVQQRREQLRDEFRSFDQLYYSLVGSSYNSPDDCRRVAGFPRAYLLTFCLNQEFATETAPPLDGPGPYHDERLFENVVTRVEDLIRAVKTFGNSLSNSKISDKAQNLETDVADYRTAVVTYLENVEAARRAVGLLTAPIPRGAKAQAASSLSETLSTQQMRTSLLLKAKESGQNMDDAQMNEILKRYQTLLRETPSRLNDVSWDTIAAVNGLPSFDETIFDDALNGRNGVRYEISEKLPSAVNQVNAAQGRLLGRVNEIYDHSEVVEALPKQIDLGGHPGNLIVYFVIRQVESFKRYNVEQLLGAPGQPAPAANQAVTLPPANPAGTTNPQPGGAGSQPAGNGQASGNPPPSDTTPGQVVARGQFAVHDLYAANVTAAFAYSGLKDASILKQPAIKGAVDPATAKPNTCTTDNCFAPIQGQRTAQLNLILGVDYYFSPRDTFPGVNHYTPNKILQSFGIVGAISANHANNWFLGLFYEPITGAQIAGGVNFGAEKRLQKNFTLGTPVDMTGDFPTEDKRINKMFLSAGLDLGLFRKIFGKITGVGAPAKGQQGN